MGKKQEIDIGYATRMLQHSPVCLLTVAAKGKMDIVPIAWLTPLSMQPPLIGVAISPRRYSHDLIKRAGEFVLNIAQADMARQVEICGASSGEDTDKFQRAGFNLAEPKRVNTPLIEECFGAIECGLMEMVALGDHTLFVGQVLTVWADPKAFDTFWKPEQPEGQTLQHFGGSYYGIVKEKFVV
ncbi:MAG: flavin reductase family protein [Chloroflexi bacterium]|uniref:Flavin reductase family protein n=1 Tax=Candidatus Chlorohelix allophototropha TaxID=3003348 RepID=A0A8T7M0E2_9CHLR|nr:flavin reductase family protein [Chloroflexota bacterium]WJW67146.1 flavin reductase family protein [Chloroflexota bacterium L227-S17]